MKRVVNAIYNTAILYRINFRFIFTKYVQYCVLLNYVSVWCLLFQIQYGFFNPFKPGPVRASKQIILYVKTKYIQLFKDRPLTKLIILIAFCKH